MAALLLKNHSRTLGTSPLEVTEYVKTNVLRAFTDQSSMIRNAAGQVIVTILGVLEPHNWKEALQLLMQALDSPAEDYITVSAPAQGPLFNF